MWIEEYQDLLAWIVERVDSFPLQSGWTELRNCKVLNYTLTSTLQYENY